ncbi:NAD(P)-dependent dehydrogenase (short-subunit alcohol dehydrogenase family) [Amycolatopsis lexingtonensis]|uniref:NAD(P)-dependent dehydrogenase (Short-subunit alcohol dehydrogenase family) n=1 Tax=Amycolatopsis lexingtonensis TaxID=218822 RepID=A0ABR9I4H5_9PSEU|nr:SDR family NAD(P)-dependent oxidoreductase [Amycolatopsis lexingtonensis]MBE1498079.1 NAD(P)-dependent dehydrogenase (short-subunit alcohol dehydrogenase family) [Amycolatopsis lexingtonensis]
MPTALVTGASAGLGRALAAALVSRQWTVVGDARDATALSEAAREIGFTAVPGDVADPAHRAQLAEACPSLDLLVNNASSLGVSPLPSLKNYPVAELENVYRVNVFAPLALTQLLLPALTASRGTIIDVSSDAAVEPYEGWGGYGSAKAALDQLTAVLGAEHPDLAVYAVDPGDLRTAMHQRAFPGEDISDRPLPSSAVPGFLRLLGERPPSGRYRVADLLVNA